MIFDSSSTGFKNSFEIGIGLGRDILTTRLPPSLVLARVVLRFDKLTSPDALLL